MTAPLENLKAFDTPVYVTRPLLPDLNDYIEKLKEIWSSKWLTNGGTQHTLLESRLSEYLKTPGISLFNNGTIALITGCQSLRLTGEVITTPFTFPATPHVLSWNGIRPVFCDIDPETMTINPANIESLITSQTTGILGVHVYGIPCDVFGIQEIADKYGLRVVYDAAHAFGVEIDGVSIGNFGDLSMFSFHATKLFHTAEGGALAYRDLHLKPRIDLLKNFGIKNEEEVVMPGINGKMNELQAALGLVVLDYVEAERQKREKLVEVYNRLLPEIPGLKIHESAPNVKGSLQYYPLRVIAKEFGQTRNQVHTRLKQYNVITRKYFYPLCSQYSCYRALPSSQPGNLPVATEIAEQVLCMPLHSDITPSDVERICEIIKAIQKYPQPE